MAVNKVLDLLESSGEGSMCFAPMFHSGTWQKSASGETIAASEASTGQFLAAVPDANSADVEQAYQAAHVAQRQWARLDPTSRATVLNAVADEIDRLSDELAYLEAVDSGNPVTAMKRDVIKGAAIFRHMAGLGHLLAGDVIPVSSSGLHYTRRYPYGVVARIVAFNHPFLFACGRVASALVAGNAVLLKPSEHTPLAGLALAKLTENIIPKGLLSVLTGGARLGAALTTHPKIQRISFTGSLSTALQISQQAANSGDIKNLSLELGGKNPLIALPDADPGQVAAALVRGMNFKAVQGQSCGSTTRAYLHESIFEEVSDRLVPLVEEIRLGEPTDVSTEMGCMINPQTRDRVLSMIGQGRQDGGRLLVGGTAPASPELSGGPYLAPTVLADLPDDSACTRTELFGPVLGLYRWNDVDDVLSRANALPYGLTASVWTNDIGQALKLVDEIDSGYVWINDVEFRHFAVPFGGWKNSGIGAEYGLEEPLSFTRSKTVVVNYG